MYEDAELFARVQKAMEPYENVVLLLPCPDLDKTLEILTARLVKLLQDNGIEVDPDGLWIMEHFVKHPSNQKLAKFVIYTEGKTPEETCEEIVQKLGKKSEP